MSSRISSSSCRMIQQLLVEQMLQKEVQEGAHLPEEEQDQLIPLSGTNEPSPRKEGQSLAPEEQADNVIDPFEQLVKNNDIVPLLAVLDKVDLQTVVQGKPLLSRMCGMHLPLEELLAGREIKFNVDEDGRTPLHQAIQADDTGSAYWCMQHNVPNSKDHNGVSAILEAIRLGRRACFLLCINFKYFDSEAAHYCAIYNRAWELKVLHRLGTDILWARDSQHMTPLERAVQNYSYDVSEYLAQVSPSIDVKELADKTDSKAIIRLVKRVHSQSKKLNYAVKPAVYFLLHSALLYWGITAFCQQSQQWILLAALLLLWALQGCILLFSRQSAVLAHEWPNYLALTRAPDFQPMEDICPYCFLPQIPGRQHCGVCMACVEGFHFHGLVCVNRSNQVFWMLLELVWLWLAHSIHSTLLLHFKAGELKILAFSSNFFFRNAAIVESLWVAGSWGLLIFFLYIKAVVLYQWGCLLQWAYMAVLHRTYQEANHSEKYPWLYRIVRTNDGSFKSQEKRLMEKGILGGICAGIRNALYYFFRD